jgi:polyisoprenoid-binding protein YceI
MLKHIFGTFSIAVLLGSTPILAAGKCEFFAKASVGVLEFTGTGCTVEGKPKIEGGKVSGEFTVDLTKLDAGVRSEHMHDKYLETKKFPKAILKLDPMPESGGAFTGKLTLHGIEKSVSGTAEKSASGFSFKFEVNTPDFGIAEASYKGITIAKTVAISGSIDK